MASSTRIAFPRPTPRCRPRMKIAAQLKLTEDFLKNGQLTVDIFALSPAQAPLKPGATTQSDLSTTFAVGEEAESKVNAESAGEVAPVTAPLNRVQPALRRGDTVRVDVVVRTKKVGHFFPGGTVDAYDTWLELKATDDKGQTIFWSGMVEDNGNGPVEKGAHFYRSLQIDAHGNPINKRNAWATRAVVYVRLIPPGAADTVHYRMYDSGKCRQQDHAACAPVLPKVLLVWNAVGLRGSPRSRRSRTRLRRTTTTARRCSPHR